MVAHWYPPPQSSHATRATVAPADAAGLAEARGLAVDGGIVASWMGGAGLQADAVRIAAAIRAASRARLMFPRFDIRPDPATNPNPPEMTRWSPFRPRRRPQGLHKGGF